MAVFSLTNAAVYVASYDMSTDLNQVSLELAAEELDSTTFGDSWRERVGGLKTVSGQVQGFWQSAASAAVDPQVFPNLGTVDRVVTVAPTTDDGEIAYTFKGVKLNYQMFGQVGELTPFTLGVMSSNGVGAVRGRMLLEKQTVSGATSGTGQELGAVSATQKLYTTIHCFSAGTTATVIVESDDNSGFLSATTRSSTTVTAAGATWVTPVDGAITDTHWRVRTTSVTGSFSLAVAVGIK